jgi:hypothetical protein
MNREKAYPFDGIHFLHNLPSAHLPHEDVGIIRRKAHNFYRMAVHAGKWQNFAAGIGTGAAYASLHGLHWHPHWLTTIEYAYQTNLLGFTHIVAPHRLILFFTNVAIFSVNLILLSINILCASLLDTQVPIAHRFVSAPKEGHTNPEAFD